MKFYKRKIKWELRLLLSLFVSIVVDCDLRSNEILHRKREYRRYLLQSHFPPRCSYVIVTKILTFPGESIPNGIVNSYVFENFKTIWFHLHKSV